MGRSQDAEPNREPAPEPRTDRPENGGRVGAVDGVLGLMVCVSGLVSVLARGRRATLTEENCRENGRGERPAGDRWIPGERLRNYTSSPWAVNTISGQKSKKDHDCFLGPTVRVFPGRSGRPGWRSPGGGGSAATAVSWGGRSRAGGPLSEALDCAHEEPYEFYRSPPHRGPLASRQEPDRSPVRPPTEAHDPDRLARSARRPGGGGLW